MVANAAYEEIQTKPASLSLETVDCNFCGSSDYSEYDSVGEWRIVKCRRCGFCFTNPRPATECLPGFYGSDYFGDCEVIRFGSINRRGSLNHGGDNSYTQRIADIESRFENRGSLLELGAATGGFLATMCRRGWTIDGIELSQEAVEIANRNERLNIFCGSLEEFETEQTYHVICMYHSLEHTPDPAYVIERSYALLNPGGIVVIEVPNLNGFDARINRERKLLSYDLPRHLSHFTPGVLAGKLEATGFKVLDVDLYYPEFILKLLERRAVAAGKNRVNDVDERRADASRSLPMAADPRNWKTALLRSVSNLLPGWRFTIVARK